MEDVEVPRDGFAIMNHCKDPQCSDPDFTDSTTDILFWPEFHLKVLLGSLDDPI